MASTWSSKTSVLKYGSTSDILDTDIKDCTLIQSQVIFRHGARTPFTVINGIPEARYDRQTFQIAPSGLEYKVMHLTGQKAEGFHKSTANVKCMQPLEGGMLTGHLTTVGAQQCYELGSQLRMRYVEKHKLITSEFNDNEVYLRSTYIQRALDSMESVISGIYGEDHLRAQEPPVFNIAYYDEECIYNNVPICKRLQEISDDGKSHLYHNNPELKALLKQLHDKINYDGDTPLSYVALCDDFVARQAHSLPLAPQLEPHYDEITQHGAAHFVRYVCGKPEERGEGLTLNVGPFYHLLLNNMDQAVKDSSVHRLMLYSSHDTMIIPLLVSLGYSDPKWPPYASYIGFEVWEHNTTSQHFVKVIYNGEELSVGDRKDMLIPYEEFRQYISQYAVSQEQRRALCNIKSTLCSEADARTQSIA